MRIIITFLLQFLLCNLCPAQMDGTIDLNFGSSGLVIKDLTLEALDDEGRCLAIQSDDKILVGGSVYNLFYHRYEFGLARFNPDGSVDSSFNGTGFVVTAMRGNDFAQSIIIQPDSKILLAGYANTYY